MGVKYDVPKTAGDSETILVVHEVVLEMVLLQLFPVSRKCFVMKKVMCHIVADVPEDPPTEYSGRRVPIPEEYGMCQLPKWCCQSYKQCGRHD